ncbi:hypothetical protein Aduo_016319 [Ancylostoma duodenale]
MWTREEVLERYRLRRDREWRERSMHRAGENDCFGEYYPWTPAHEHYLPNRVRIRLERRWMHTYAELRLGSENATKAEIIWATFVEELHKYNMYDQPHSSLDQLRWLFKRWIIGTYRTDPKKDQKEHNTCSIDTELERLLYKYNEALDNLSTMRPSMFKQYEQRSEYYNSLTNYLRKNETYEPLQTCMLTTLDRDGNTRQIPFLRTALGKLDQQVLKCLKDIGEEIDTDVKGDYRMAREEPNLATWMLTTEEKTEEEIRNYRDRVWVLAVQNWDYIRRSKAL